MCIVKSRENYALAIPSSSFIPVCFVPWSLVNNAVAYRVTCTELSFEPRHTESIIIKRNINCPLNVITYWYALAVMIISCKRRSRRSRYHRPFYG